MTSAPRSPSSIAASGPASTREKSATTIPSSIGASVTSERVRSYPGWPRVACAVARELHAPGECRGMHLELANRALGALVDLNPPAHYVHWHFFQMSVANVVVI